MPAERKIVFFCSSCSHFESEVSQGKKVIFEHFSWYRNIYRRGPSRLQLCNVQNFPALSGLFCNWHSQSSSWFCPISRPYTNPPHVTECVSSPPSCSMHHLLPAVGANGNFHSQDWKYLALQKAGGSKASYIAPFFACWNTHESRPQRPENEWPLENLGTTCSCNKKVLCSWINVVWCCTGQYGTWQLFPCFPIGEDSQSKN